MLSRIKTRRRSRLVIVSSFCAGMLPSSWGHAQTASQRIADPFGGHSGSVAEVGDEALIERVFKESGRDLQLWRQFVTDSNVYVEGLPRDDVLNALEFIAVQDTGYSEIISSGAVKAIVHLSASDPGLRERLLRIISSENCGSGARTQACQLIRYVADDSVQQTLLELMKAHWGTKKADDLYWYSLRDLSSAAFLRFIEKRASDPKEKSWLRERCMHHLPEVRAAQSLESTIRLLETNVQDEDLDTQWLLRQAARLGGTRQQLRAAMLGRLRKTRDRGTSQEARHPLGVAIDEYGLLTPDDAKKYPIIGDRVTIRTVCGDSPFPPWATRHKELERRYYRRDLAD